MHDYFSFILAGTALIVSPGPATLSMAACGAAFGFSRSIGFLFGCASGLIAVCLLSALGLNALLQANPAIHRALAIAGLIYILYLAWKIATAKVDSLPLVNSTQKVLTQTPPTYFNGILLSLTNPKAYAVTAALFSSFPAVGTSPSTDLSIKLFLLAFITVAGNLAWTGCGSYLKQHIAQPQQRRFLNFVFAFLLIISVFWAFSLNSIQ